MESVRHVRHTMRSMPMTALEWICEQRPEVRRPTALCIVDAVPQRGDRSHNGLQDEPKRHRAGWPRDQLVPDAVANLLREAVPEHANSCERDHQDNDQTSQKNLSFRWRLCHGASSRLQKLVARRRRPAPRPMSLVRGGALETQDVDLAFTISVGQATIVKPLATATFCAPFAVLGDHAAAEALAPKFFAGGVLGDR